MEQTRACINSPQGCHVFLKELKKDAEVCKEILSAEAFGGWIGEFSIQSNANKLTAMTRMVWRHSFSVRRTGVPHGGQRVK